MAWAHALPVLHCGEQQQDLAGEQQAS